MALIFIIIDLSLLPMLHFGTLPWKPSLLLIMVVSLVQLRRGGIRENAPAVPIFVLSGVLIITTVIGTLAYWMVAGTAPGGESQRLILILALIPLSFIVGFSSRVRNLHYVGWIVVVMVALNFAMFAFPEPFSDVASFYGLDKAYESGSYNPESYYGRPAGIFINPNISGLAITVLMTYIVMGFRLNLIRTNPALLSLYLGTGVFGLLVLMSRTQLAASILVLSFALFWGSRSQRLGIVISALIALVFVGVIPTPVAVFTESVIGFDIGVRLEGLVTAVIESTSADANIQLVAVVALLLVAAFLIGWRFLNGGRF